MALIKCPECGFEVEESRDMCPHCGYSFKDICLDDSNSWIIDDCLIQLYFQPTGCIIVPDNIKKIEMNAFKGCSSLKSIVLSKNLESIGSNAFLNCSSLKRIHVPDNVTIIGDNAFRGCTSLKSISLPKKINYFGRKVFSECNSLTIYCRGPQIPSLVEDNWHSNRPVVMNCIAHFTKDNINYGFLNSGELVVASAANTSLVNVKIPSEVDGIKVTSIGNHAFDGCSQLFCIDIPDSVESINPFAFFNCPILSINIPKSVKTIGNYAFSGCTFLSSVNIPEGIKIIANGAFSGCSSLEHMNIPNSVTIIGYYAFKGCFSLKSIFIPKSVSLMGVSAFENCMHLSIYCGADSQPFEWEKQWNISQLPVFWGCIGQLTKDNITYIAFCDGSLTVISVVEKYCHWIEIPSKVNDKCVTSIADFAFWECKYVASISIANGVKSIGKFAFGRCQFTVSIVIPNSVVSIGENAFKNCDKELTINCEAKEKPATWCDDWNCGHNVVWNYKGKD